MSTPLKHNVVKDLSDILLTLEDTRNRTQVFKVCTVNLLQQVTHVFSELTHGRRPEMCINCIGTKDYRVHLAGTKLDILKFLMRCIEVCQEIAAAFVAVTYGNLKSAIRKEINLEQRFGWI